MNSEFIRKLTTEFLDAVHNLNRTSVEFNLAKDRLTLALKGVYVELEEGITKEEIGKVAELLCKLTPFTVKKGILFRHNVVDLVSGIGASGFEAEAGGFSVGLYFGEDEFGDDKCIAIITSDHADWN